jgi:hypothetical protein
VPRRSAARQTLPGRQSRSSSAARTGRVTPSEPAPYLIWLSGFHCPSCDLTGTYSAGICDRPGMSDNARELALRITAMPQNCERTCRSAHKNACNQHTTFGMSDRWAGRTALRRSWLQFEAVELPGPVAHGAEPLWAACTLIRTGTRSRRKPLPTADAGIGHPDIFGARGQRLLDQADRKPVRANRSLEGTLWRSREGAECGLIRKHTREVARRCPMWLDGRPSCTDSRW